MTAANRRPAPPRSSSTTSPSRTTRPRREGRHARARSTTCRLEVPAGKICVLVGPSGCGKTTTLKMVNRLIEPTSGRILHRRRGRRDAGRRPSCGAASATSSSRSGLFPHQTIGDNVATVPAAARLGRRRRMRARADELLDARRPRPGAVRAIATRRSSPAASASASAWRGRSPRTRR